MAEVTKPVKRHKNNIKGRKKQTEAEKSRWLVMYGFHKEKGLVLAAHLQDRVLAMKYTVTQLNFFCSCP